MRAADELHEAWPFVFIVRISFAKAVYGEESSPFPNGSNVSSRGMRSPSRQTGMQWCGFHESNMDLRREPRRSPAELNPRKRSRRAEYDWTAPMRWSDFSLNV